MRHVIQQYGAAAFKHVKSLIHLVVPVNGNSRSFHYLLRAHRDIRRARRCAEFDENISMIAKVDEMFPFVCSERIPLSHCGLTSERHFRQHLTDAKSSDAQQE